MLESKVPANLDAADPNDSALISSYLANHGFAFEGMCALPPN